MNDATLPDVSGADALLAQLLRNGSDTIFGLPGGQLDHFFDAMVRCEQPIRFFGSRHEQGAAYMAFGAARATGRPATYVVVPGPGVLNTTAALCSAYATNEPVLCLTGQIPSAGLGKGIGYLHELPDQLATLRTLTKWAARIDEPEDAPARVNEAFRQMLSGRRRPAALEMPMDKMAARTTIEPLPPAEIQANPTVDTDAIDRAAKLLAGAQRPLIVAGGGAIGATEALSAVAERLQAPVVTFRNGRGVISDRHYLSMNLPGGYQLWKTADVVIGVGSRMEQQLLHWGRGPDMAVIRIDIDPEELDRIDAPTVALHADAHDALSALDNALERRGVGNGSRRSELEDLKHQVRAEVERVQPQVAFLDVIRECLPDDGVFVDEITQVGYASWYAFPVYAPRRLITCGYQGTLGYGYATALGAAIAQPDNVVVNIAGDGGFLFTANEMATASRYDIPLVTVLFNNNKFQNVQRQQREWFGGRIIGSDLKNPDFCRFAASFDIDAERVSTPQQLGPRLHAAIEKRRPALIEVSVDDMPSPWSHIIKERLFPSANGER